MKLHWGNSILIFFILFLSLCAVFIVFSLRQNNDLVTRDYYERGANYSKMMEIKKRSLVYQDSVVVQVSEAEVNLEFAPGMVHSIDEVELFFYRSSDQSKDMLIQQELNTTSIALKGEVFDHGRYKLQIRWKLNNEAYQLDHIIDIQ